MTIFVCLPSSLAYFHLSLFLYPSHPSHLILPCTLIPFLLCTLFSFSCLSSTDRYRVGMATTASSTLRRVLLRGDNTVFAGRKRLFPQSRTLLTHPPPKDDSYSFSLIQSRCPFHPSFLSLRLHSSRTMTSTATVPRKRLDEAGSEDWTIVEGNGAERGDAVEGSSHKTVIMEEKKSKEDEKKAVPTVYINEKGEPDLYSLRVELKKENGETIQLDAVYQDNFPSGSSIGTAVMMHGSPGSHADFKYVTPTLTKEGIRIIGVNFPGFGYSEDEPSLQHVNTERIAFVESLVSSLSLKSPIVFVGHSRGSENALMLAARNQDTSEGAVMVNPTGLRIHRGTRPHVFFVLLSWLYHTFPIIRPFLEWGKAFLYNMVGLRVKTGRVAAVAVHTMGSLALHRQEEYMETLQRSGEKRLLFCYSGDDWIIEREVSQEFEEKIKDKVHIECLTDDPSEEEELTKKMIESLSPSSSFRAVAAFFHTDNHFLQKHRANFIAQGIKTILTTASEKK